MAITAASFTSGNGAGLSSKATASKTWVSGNLYYFGIASYNNGTPAIQPTVTGCDLIGTDLGSGGAHERLSLFRFLGDGSTGTRLIDFGTGNTQAHFQWVIDEFTGTKISGTNGADSVVQSSVVFGHSASISTTLATFADPTDDACWAVCLAGSGAAETPQGSLVTLTSESNFFVLRSAWQLGQNTAPTFSIPGVSDWDIGAIEVAAAGGGGGGRTLFMQSGLDGHSIAGPKQFNPSLTYHRHRDSGLYLPDKRIAA